MPKIIHCIDELKAIYKQLHTKGKGGFRTADPDECWYWSSSEYYEGSAWDFSFRKGKASKGFRDGDHFDKSFPRLVRAVRTLP